jgi:hypothetical protein
MKLSASHCTLRPCSTLANTHTHMLSLLGCTEKLGPDVRLVGVVSDLQPCIQGVGARNAPIGRCNGDAPAAA